MAKEIESNDLYEVVGGRKGMPMYGGFNEWLLTASDDDLIFYSYSCLKKGRHDMSSYRVKIKEELIKRGYQVTDTEVYKDGKVVYPED